MFDFIGNTLSRVLGAGHDELAADEKATNPFPHGPQRFRSVTNGQIRRLQARRAAAQKRKTNKRFRREWMRNERAFNALRSQLVVVGAIPSSHYAEDALMENVERHLEAAYGSVEAAEDYYGALVAERQ